MLWIFGNNSSCIFNKTSERRFSFYKKYRNGNFPFSWSELLSKKLNLKLKNFAVSGQSNYDIFEWFCRNSTSFKENDLIIIGWAPVVNYRLCDEYTNDFISIRPNSISVTNKPKILNGIEIDTINQITKNRLNSRWNQEIYNWEILIKEICDLKKCNVFFWTLDSDLNQLYYLSGNHKNFKDYLISIGAQTIKEETSGELNDDHFGEIGQNVLSDYFYEKLKTLYNG